MWTFSEFYSANVKRLKSPTQVLMNVMMENFQELKERQEEGLREIIKLWKEIGFDEEDIRSRKQTVFDHFDGILSRMVQEEKNYKSKLLDSIERNNIICAKLRKEMGVRWKKSYSYLDYII